MHQNSWSNKITFGILLAITFLAPIFFVPASFVSTQFGTSLLFAFGVIASVLIYTVSTLVSGSMELPKPGKYILGLTALVPIIYTLSGISGGFSRMSFFGYTFDIGTVGFVILGFVYLFLVSILFANRKRIFYSYFAVVLSSILLSLFLLIRMIFGVEVLGFGMFNEIASTMVGNFNNVGIFFGIGAILSLLTYEMVNVSRVMKVLLCVALALSLFFLAVVNFTIVWIIVAVCSFIFILYRYFNTGSHHNHGFLSKYERIPKLTFIVLIISVVFAVFSSTVGVYLSERMSIANFEVRPTLSVTMDIARNTVISQPLFGSGPNTFTLQWLIWKPNEIVSTIFWNTDFSSGIGLIPTFAVTTGIVGILSWLAFLGFYIYLGFKSIFAKIEDGFVKYLIVSSFFISFYLWFMTFVYVPSTSIFILTLFFTGVFFSAVYLSDIIRLERRHINSSPSSGFLSSLILVVVLLSSVSLGYGLFRNSTSLWYFQKGSYELNTNNDIDKGEQYVKKAIEAVPLDVYYRALSEIGIIKINQILSADPKTLKPEEAQKQFTDALSESVKAGLFAKDADPLNYINWIALGRVYEAVSIPDLKIEGAYESAQFAYIEALKRNPKNPGILTLLSRLATVKNDLATARGYANQAISLKNNYIDAYFLLSQIEVADKNIKGAIESIEKALVIEPTNTGMLFQLGLLKYNNKDYGGAITALQEGLKISPDYANAKYFLGLSLDATGESEKALAVFEDVFKTNSDNKDLQTIITNLKNGESALKGLEQTSPEKAENLPVRDTE